MAFVRSISGLRATLGKHLTPETVSAYCCAFSAILPEGKIIVGRDGRPSGRWIEQVVSGALNASGREVEIIGIVPTPTVQLMAEHSSAAGGIAITASHNPSQWNGLKFLNSSGIFLDAEENKMLWNAVDNKEYDLHDSKYPPIHTNSQAIADHIKRILSLPFFSGTDILERVRARKFKVTVDAVNASGSLAVTSLLKEMGCEVNELYCDNSGIFPHTPEPLPENLTALSEEVKKSNSDLGIAVDPDADRLVLTDSGGTLIGEEKTIALAVETVFLLKDYFRDYDLSAVVNLSTTRLVEDSAEKFSAKVYRSAVGEINVVKLMKETNSVIGGEGSGGVILPACHYGRDSLVGTALILVLLTIRDSDLAEIAGNQTQYHMLKLKQDFSGKIDTYFEKIIKLFPNADINLDDGLKISLSKSWVQVRASNTEPIIRIIAEAPTAEETKQLTDTVLKSLK